MTAPTVFDPAQLLADASTTTGGLQDFGDDSFRPALDVLCLSLNYEAQLSATGEFILRQKLVDQLSNRLRIEDWFARHPEIADEVIAAPLVIVGLPRTGTTKLHRMLALDPRFHWMAFWESQFPVPLPDETLKAPDVRIANARAMVDMMTAAMPELAAMHPMDAVAADEEVMLMEHSMQSSFDAYANVPSYDNWLDTSDQTPAYRYLRRMLQFLQWQKRQRAGSNFKCAERWVLKAPHHLARMDILLREFPGVQVIQTHRDPLQSIPSLASFIHTLWCIYSDAVDPKTVGRMWNKRMQTALSHTLELRRTAPAHQFLDVQFQATVQQPMEVAADVYEFVGWPMDDALQNSLNAWMAADAESHLGGHSYEARTFGLCKEQLRRDFSAYRKRHVQA